MYHVTSTWLVINEIYYRKQTFDEYYFMIYNVGGYIDKSAASIVSRIFFGL